MSRTCTKGHVVPEDYLKVCPRCGAGLPRATAPAERVAPRQERVDVPKLVPFLIGAVLVAVFGGLLTYAAKTGPAEIFGYVLLAGAALLAVIGVYDGVRRRSS